PPCRSRGPPSSFSAAGLMVSKGCPVEPGGSGSSAGFYRWERSRECLPYWESRPHRAQERRPDHHGVYLRKAATRESPEEHQTLRSSMYQRCDLSGRSRFRSMLGWFLLCKAAWKFLSYSPSPSRSGQRYSSRSGVAVVYWRQGLEIHPARRWRAEY